MPFENEFNLKYIKRRKEGRKKRKEEGREEGKKGRRKEKKEETKVGRKRGKEEARAP